MSLLRLNTPRYFAPEKESDFLFYLENEIEHYFVVLTGEVIAGCGGIKLADNQSTGKLSWDIIHPDFQGMGVGRMLVNIPVDGSEFIQPLRNP